MHPFTILFIITTSASIILMAYMAFKLKMNLTKDQKELQRILKRNEETHAFRMKILHLYGADALESLPDYATMVYDTKELTFSNYLNETQILNLN